MQITVSTAASKRPVTLEQAKTHLQISHTADDRQIDGMIRAATTLAEEYCNRAFIQQTITLELDATEAFSPLFLPRAPFSSLTSFKYYDTDGTATAVSSSVYYVSGTDPAHIIAKDGGWQMYRRHKSHQVIYVAGYGTGPSSVPWPIKQAILILVADMWNNPESLAAGGKEHPASAYALLQPYRLLVP